MKLMLSVQVIITIFSLAHAWTLQYKADLGPDGFIGRSSFTAADKPWMPPGTGSSTLMHLHYFGDWVLSVAYGGIARPYDPLLEIPAQIPPVGLIFFSVAYLIGYKLSYVLLLVLTMYIWYQLMNKLFPNLDLFYRLLIIIFVVLATMPTLIAIDRGGTLLFCIGLAGLSYVNFQEGKKKLGFFQYLIAVSQKPYLIFFLLALLLEKKKPFLQNIKDAIFTFVYLLVTNLLAMFLFADNLLVGVRDSFNAIARFSGDLAIPWMMDGASLTSFVSKSFEFVHGQLPTVEFMNHFVPFWPRIIAIIFLALLLFVICNHSTSPVIKMVLILSTASLVSPYSGPYTLTWMSLAFCFILSEIYKGFDVAQLNLVNKIAFYSILTSVYVGLTPYFGYLYMFSGVTSHVPGNYFSTPFVIFTLLLTAFSSVFDVLINLKKRKNYSGGSLNI